MCHLSCLFGLMFLLSNFEKSLGYGQGYLRSKLPQMSQEKCNDNLGIVSLFILKDAKMQQWCEINEMSSIGGLGHFFVTAWPPPPPPNKIKYF
jgi:hypothetical protein